ncbi:MAG: CBS domain-containing protein, partial [Nitrospirales bacterium]
MVTADSLMKRTLVAVPIGTTVVEAARLMTERKVGSVLVEDDGAFVGIVTETDIVRKVIGTDRLPYHTTVETVMSSPVVGIEWRRPITEAADLMERYSTRHLASD